MRIHENIRYEWYHIMVQSCFMVSCFMFGSTSHFLGMQPFGRQHGLQLAAWIPKRRLAFSSSWQWVKSDVTGNLWGMTLLATQSMHSIFRNNKLVSVPGLLCADSQLACGLACARKQRGCCSSHLKAPPYTGSRLGACATLSTRKRMTRTRATSPLDDRRLLHC